VTEKTNRQHFSFNLTQKETTVLKSIAKQSIEAAVNNTTPPQLNEVLQQSERFSQSGGGFVTLTIDGMLRGCIGEIFPSRSIAEVVLERAADAALADPRFPPLSPSELDLIAIEISLLSPPWSVDNYDEIKIGLHGIVLSKERKSAVFLPQVATEQEWDIETTLTQLAQKAGLPADGWKSGASFSVFTADIF
jgi:AmmeMemoRadiSam system protein A